MRNNSVSNNRIENVMQRLRDGAHIYMLSNQSGSVISGNLLINSDDRKGGIYFDQGSAEISVFNNAVTDTKYWINATAGDVGNIRARNNYSDAGEKTGTNTAENNSIYGSEDINSPTVHDICENAGISEIYKQHEYEYNDDITCGYLKKLMFNPYGIEMINASEYTDFYDTDGEPSIDMMYDGTGVERIVDISAGEWTEYDISVPEDGRYRMIIMATAGGDNGSFGICIDGESMPNIPVKKTGAYWGVKPLFNDGGTYTLNRGVHRIRIELGAVLHCFGFIKEQTA